MTNRFKILVCSLLCVLYFSTAFAEESKNSSVILNMGNSYAQHACESPWTLLADPGFECSERYQVFRLAYNYKFTPAWGFEFSGGDISNSKGSGTYIGDPFTFQMKTTGLTLAGIGNFTLGEKISLFAKIGVARVVLKENIRRITAGTTYNGISLNGVDTTDYEQNSLTYGIGFQYNFDTDYGVRIQYENFGKFDVYTRYGLTSPEPISLTVVSAGLVINF